MLLPGGVNWCEYLGSKVQAFGVILLISKWSSRIFFGKGGIMEYSVGNIHSQEVAFHKDPLSVLSLSAMNGC